MDSQKEKLASVAEHLNQVSTNVHVLDKHYMMNRLDDIDTLLNNVSEIIEELDVSCRCANLAQPSNVTETKTIINTNVYNNKIKYYVLNKKIMKQLLPLYCALWIRYQS